MALETQPGSVALVVGVTGMAGLSLAKTLKKPGTAGEPWKVYGVAQRDKPVWFPPSIVDQYIQCNTLDPNNTRSKISPLLDVTHVFWVALQTRDTEEENIAVNSAMLVNVLDALTARPQPRLRHVCLQTGTKQYMGPIFDPVHSSRVSPPEPPFREDSVRLPFPNFYYALEDILADYSAKSSGVLTYSIHRSSIIIGASSRSIYNCLLSLVVYALICRRENLPFKFPGNRYTWEHFCDASDSGLLAEQQIWAATAVSARNQAFNCSNGDVFTWRSFWKVLADVIGVDFVPFSGEEFDWISEMKGKSGVWDAIVEEHGLLETKMDEITCFEAVHVVLNFGFQHVCSMNKSREFGFFGYRNTLKSIGHWVDELREMNIIPKP